MEKLADALAHDDSTHAVKSLTMRLDKTETKLVAAKSKQSNAFESCSKLIGSASAPAQRI